ncbi:MAG: hypothetical protein E7388_06900 [Ruminococcaceae bacterium]|nr:hypothetical protein [Oscillospiraceae bacterium]
MKQFKLSRDIFNKFAGLSCVENYLLYVLVAENYPYQCVYYKSYISLVDIITSFINGEKYESFHAINRLHSVAAFEGLINIRRFNYGDFKCFNSYDFNCIEVKPEYMIKKYGQSLWRNDHYILLGEGNNLDLYFYINDVPRDIGNITKEELKDASAGNIFCFNIRKMPDDIQKKNFFISFYKSLQSKNENNIGYIDDIIMARDIIGVHKIICKRVMDFCNQYIQMNFYKAHLSNIEKLFTRLEYMRLSKENNLNRVNSFMEYMVEEDSRYIEILRNKLEELL